MAFGSTLNPITGKRQRLTVSSAVVQFDKDKYTVSSEDAGATGRTAKRLAGGAMLQITGADSLYYTIDSSDPVAGSVGFEMAPGDILYLDSYHKVQNFKALRKTTDTSIEAVFLFGN